MVMEKKNYSRPSLMVEKFTPQEYVAACSITEDKTVYKAKCDAGGILTGGLWQETNSQPGLQMTGNNKDKHLTAGIGNNFTSCGNTFYLPLSTTFLDGYYTAIGLIPVKVKIWQEGGKYHATQSPIDEVNEKKNLS
jgi:hypothetical protein